MTRSESAWVRRVLAAWDQEEREHTYARLWGMERYVFMLREAAFAVQRRRIEPLIGGWEATWMVSRRGTKAFVFVGCEKALNRQIDAMLSQYAAYRRRRDRVKNAAGFYLPEHVTALWEIQGGRCYFSNEVLGRTFKEATFEIDHLWPLAAKMFHPAFGTNWPTNLALVTPRVNRMKGGSPAADFVAEIKRSKAFELRPTKERNQIDRCRHDTFRAFMEQHCSADEVDWLG